MFLAKPPKKKKKNRGYTGFVVAYWFGTNPARFTAPITNRTGILGGGNAEKKAYDLADHFRKSGFEASVLHTDDECGVLRNMGY